jgi:hypothetical protein
LRFFLDAYVGQEPGDPRKAARAIITITGEADPSRRLPLGNDAPALLRHVHRSAVGELERWAPLTKSTDLDGLEVSDVDHPVLSLKSV